MLSLNISKPSNEDVITTFDSFTCQLKTHRTNINNDNNYVTLLHFAQWSCWGQFERTQELTAHKLRMHTKLSSIHTFWTTNLLSCAAKSDHVKTQNWVPQSPSQHCTNSSKDTVTHSETANQHPTTKRTHCTKQHATLLAAKRSVVTSDATETKLHLHNSKYKYKNCTSMQAHNKRPIKRLQFPNNQPKLLHQTTHS